MLNKISDSDSDYNSENSVFFSQIPDKLSC